MEYGTAGLHGPNRLCFAERAPEPEHALVRQLLIVIWVALARAHNLNYVKAARPEQYLPRGQGVQFAALDHTAIVMRANVLIVILVNFLTVREAQLVLRV